MPMTPDGGSTARTAPDPHHHEAPTASSGSTAPPALHAGETPTARAELHHEFSRYARALHTLRAQLAEILPTGLDPAAAQLLAWLVKQGPSRQTELAAETFLDPSTVSRRVSQLVQRGLVERRLDPNDGRAAQLVPTTAGAEVFAQLRARNAQTMEQVLGGWSDDDVTALAVMLRKFNDSFESYRSRLNAPMATGTGSTPRGDT